jgi:hypothetical protein
MGWTHRRSELARTIRDHPDADTTELRRQLKAERLEEHIKNLVNDAPKLTDAQRNRIALALLGGGFDDDAAANGDARMSRLSAKARRTKAAQYKPAVSEDGGDFDAVT